MNDELIKSEALIKRIDERFTSLNDVPVRDVRLTREEWALIRPHISDCRAALSSQSNSVVKESLTTELQKYVPMTEDELSDIYFSAEQDELDGFAAIQTEVIRRAGLDVEK